MRHKWAVLGMFITLGWALLHVPQARIHAEPPQQEAISATPAVITLPQITLNSIQQDFTATPTPTMTPPPAVMLEAIDSANVRSKPDPSDDTNRLGTIHNGDFYPVIGRYYQWLQIQYTPSPDGRAWVFSELVTVSGDINTVPDLSQQPTATIDAALAAATAGTPLPGGATAISTDGREIAAPEGVIGTINPTTQVQGTVLPTYTYPPDIVALAPTDPPPTATPPPDVLPISVNDGIPPIVPIIVLGGFGLLGLIVSSIRRS